MKQLHNDLWVLHCPFKLFGVDFRNCMTVIRLGKELLLHSPVAYTEEFSLPDAQVKILLAPNRFHTLFFPEWKQAYPEASIYAPTKKVQYDVRLDAASIAHLNEQYSDTLWFYQIEGLPILKEVVCLHRPSKTLVLTDLCFNHHSADRFSKIAYWLYGSYGKFGPTRLMRYFIKKNRQQFKASLDVLLQQDFERIIVSHGEMVENNGKQRMIEAFDWL